MNSPVFTVLFITLSQSEKSKGKVSSKRHVSFRKQFGCGSVDISGQHKELWVIPVHTPTFFFFHHSLWTIALQQQGIRPKQIWQHAWRATGFSRGAIAAQGLLLTPCAKTQSAERHVFKRDFKRPYHGWQMGVAGNLAKKTKWTRATYSSDSCLYKVWLVVAGLTCCNIWVGMQFRFVLWRSTVGLTELGGCVCFQVVITEDVGDLFVYLALCSRLQDLFKLTSNALWHRVTSVKNPWLENGFVMTGQIK